MSVATPIPPVALAVAMQLVTRYRMRLADPGDSRLDDLGGDYALTLATWTGPRAALVGFFTPPDDPQAAAGDLRRRCQAAAAWGERRMVAQGADQCEVLLVSLAPLPPLPSPALAPSPTQLSVVALDTRRHRAGTVLGRPSRRLPGAGELGRIAAAVSSGAPVPTLAAVDLAERQAMAGAYRQAAPVNWSAQPLATYSLIALFVAVFAVEMLASSTLHDPTAALLNMGALWSVPNATAPPDWWRFVSDAFLHDNSSLFSMHLIFNCLAMLFIGRIVEQLYGRLVLIGTFLLTAAGGGLLWYAVQNTTGASGGLTIGASGGIMGLTGLLLLVGRVQGRGVPSSLLHGIRSYAGYVIVFNLFFGAMMPNVNNWAHAGGFATGALMGLAIPPLQRLGGRDLALWERAVLLLITAVGVVALGFAVVNTVTTWGLTPY